MSKDVVIVWKDKEGQLVTTYRDEDGRIRVMDADVLDEQQGKYVSDEDELLTELNRLSGERLYVPIPLARGVLGWDV